MSSFNFETCRLNDAEITQIKIDRSSVLVSYRDWQEKEHLLEFEVVAGYQWFSPEGKVLSHGTVDVEDPLVDLACRAAEEDSTDGFRVFSFVSAWNDLKILRVVAKKVRLIS
jgi:hypothetical protein